MKKINKRNNAGYIDLNQARLEKNEKPRPKVKQNKKAASSRSKVDSSQNKESKSIPTINKTNKVKSVNNVAKPQANKNGFFPRDNNGKLLVSRRTVIYGAIGIGAIAAGGAGIKFVGDKMGKSGNTDNTLEVPKSNVISSDTLTEDKNLNFKIAHDITLPYGSLAWSNSSKLIACLVPTETSKPLSMVQLIDTNSGSITTVLKESVGLKSGFEIYDVRANEYGIIWTEVNILQGEWRIYASKLNDDYSINPVMIDTSKSDWETPTICICDNYVYWQVLPEPNGSKSKLYSSLKKQNLSSLKKNDEDITDNAQSNEDIKNNPFTVYTSLGRMSTPPYSYEKGVVITPRLNGNNVVHQLTYINNNEEILDSIALPQNMKPLVAGYGKTGFNFSFDAIYNYGEGISNLGTYTPIINCIGNYVNSKWLNFSRIPTAAPAWYKDYFIVRSSMAVCVIDLNNSSYCVIDRPNASDDYGDYLASSGNCNNIVTYANVFDQPVSGEDKKYCSLRIWEEA